MFSLNLRCQLERVVLTENLAHNKILEHAYVKTIRMQVQQHGFFINSTTVPADCLNKNIPLNLNQLRSLHRHCREMYQGPVASLLGPAAGVEQETRTMAKLSYLLDVVQHTPVAQVWSILISSDP